VLVVTWGPSGELLVNGGSDGLLRWWEVHSGECVRVQEAHQGAIRSLRSSPDGSRLASCGEDGAITLWDLDRGEYLRTLRRDRPYERLNITGIRGVTQAQEVICSLKTTRSARGFLRNNIINCRRPRQNGIVPFPVERVWSDGEGEHVFIGHLASRWIVIRVELALHCQAGFPGGRRNQFEDHGIADERFATPILADPGKEAMLNLVPFARSRRETTEKQRLEKLKQFWINKKKPQPQKAQGVEQQKLW
jgi:hypothetical protein